MNILLITAYFPPDTGSAAHLFYELGIGLLNKGHSVSVITDMPGYFALGSIEKYKGKRWIKERLNGIEVLRIAAPRPPRHLMVGRALWQFSAAFAFLLASLNLKRHDVAIVYSPPLPLGLTAWVLKKQRGTPFILNVQDLFPQSIIDLGILKNHFLIRVFEAIERFLYKRADLITVHSDGNKDHILNKLKKDKKDMKRTKKEAIEKVKVVPNWVDTGFIKPADRMNGFRREYGLNDAFVVSFAGVLGYSQDVDVILEAAQIIGKRRLRPEIIFLIVGDGVEKNRLQAKAQELCLKNVYFLPMQPRERYPNVLHASDVGLVTLHAEVRTPVVPSKILSIMAAGRPVVAAMNLNGDGPRLISEAGCGLCVPPEDAQALADAVLKLYYNPSLREELGLKGRDYAERFLSLDKAVEKYENLINCLIK